MIQPDVTVISPAELLQGILTQSGLLVLPGQSNTTTPYTQTPGDGSTLCYACSMPDDVDQAVCIYNAQGRWFGRLQKSARSIVHPGLKLHIRALNERIGYALANTIAQALDAIPCFTTITIEQTQHFIQSVYRVTPIIGMGEEPGKRRVLYLINARMALQWSELLG